MKQVVNMKFRVNVANDLAIAKKRRVDALTYLNSLENSSYKESRAIYSYVLAVNKIISVLEKELETQKTIELKCESKPITGSLEEDVGWLILNEFRHDHGQGHGVYRHTWADGKKDSEHMDDIVSGYDGCGADFVRYVKLEMARRYCSL